MALLRWGAGPLVLLQCLGARPAVAGPASAAGASPHQHVEVVHDVAYGDDRAQRMDVYVPRAAAGAPVVLMVHGGAWRTGDKKARAVVENKVARWVPLGFVFISINYRMLPRADPMRQAEDVARALATAQAKAASWGGDATRFILVGHSAGAHLVGLLAAAPSRAFGLGAKPWLGTICLDSAALDVEQIMQRRHLRFYDNAFGRDPAFWRSVSPFHALSKDATPILAVCSTTRRDRPCSQAHAFAARAAPLGVRALVSEQRLSHGLINEDLGTPGAYTDAVEAFMGTLDAGVKKALSRPPSGAR